MLIEIDREYLIRLLARDMHLEALEAAGVDNWDCFGGVGEEINRILSLWNKHLYAPFSEESIKNGEVSFEDIAREYAYQNFNVVRD